jgi:hypothetical protein
LAGVEDPLDVIVLDGYRFKIELGFRQGLHVIGTYAYPPSRSGTMHTDRPPSELGRRPCLTIDAPRISRR